MGIKLGILVGALDGVSVGTLLGIFVRITDGRLVGK